MLWNYILVQQSFEIYHSLYQQRVVFSLIDIMYNICLNLIPCIEEMLGYLLHGDRKSTYSIAYYQTVYVILAGVLAADAARAFELRVSHGPWL